MINKFRKIDAKALEVISYLQEMKTLPCGAGFKLDDNINVVIHGIYQKEFKHDKIQPKV
jgi:hypothetical protein